MGGGNAHSEATNRAAYESRHARGENSYRPGVVQYAASEQHPLDAAHQEFKGSFLSRSASPTRFMQGDEKHRPGQAQRG